MLTLNRRKGFWVSANTVWKIRFMHVFKVVLCPLECFLHLCGESYVVMFPIDYDVEKINMVHHLYENIVLELFCFGNCCNS